MGSRKHYSGPESDILFLALGLNASNLQTSAHKRLLGDPCEKCVL